MKLHFLNGAREGTDFSLKKDSICKIGRETDNDIQLLLPGVSRYHAVISCEDGKWLIRDIGSRNGTKVNTKRILESTVLAAGNVVAVGDQAIMCIADESASPEPPPAVVEEKAETAEEARPEQIDDKADEIKEPAGEKKAQEQKKQKLISLSGSAKDNKEKAAVKKVVFSPVAKKAEAANNNDDKETEKAEATAAPEHTKDKDDKQKDHSENIGEILKLDHLFSHNKAKKDSKAENDGTDGGKRKRGNLLFYVLVICGAAIFVSLFFHFVVRPKDQAGKNIVKAKPKEFLLFYEKEKRASDNIFVFTLKIENKTAFFTVDDLKSSRHFKKEIKEVADFLLEQFQKEIEETDFMDLQSSNSYDSSDGNGEIRELIICSNDKFNRVEIVNDFAPTSFQTIEKSVEEFAEHYGLQTVSLTPEELMKKANAYFYKAEELFENRQARVENLREAIARYRLAMDYLEQFSPKPPIWKKANSRLQEAEKIRKSRMEELKHQFVDSKKLKNYEDARSAAESLMQLSDPDSKMYRRARKSKMTMDKIIREQRQL